MAEREAKVEGAARCTEQGCQRVLHRRGLCRMHYYAGLKDGSLPRARSPKGKGVRTRPRSKAASQPSRVGSVPPVAADYAYPDVHPKAPGGQRIAVYTCPACGGEHLVSWLPFDEHPGLKIATCRKKAAAQNAPIPMFFVLAPARVLEAPPSELRPFRRETTVEAGEGVSNNRLDDDDDDFVATEVSVA